MDKDAPQLPLFLEGPAPSRVRPADPPLELVALGAGIPARVHLGTSSWSFPGWRGLVYEGRHGESALAREGLQAYAAHPLFRTVAVDRGHYQPLPVEVLKGYAASVPEGFRFLVKAHEALTLKVFPTHARYGAHRGQPSPWFLDQAYARDLVVHPFVAGLGEKAGPLLFQFAAQDVGALGGPLGFCERVHAFLRGLPRGPLYAVEVRNQALLTPALATALDDAGAVYCWSAIDGMPDLPTQVELLGHPRQRALVVRWLLRRGLSYEGAQQRYTPYDRIVDVDDATRDAVVALVRACDDRTPAFVIVNNKAEGSSPLTLERIARRLQEP